MEALQMLKFSLCSGHILDFTPSIKAEYEVNLLELMTDEEADVSMGTRNTFIQNLLAQNDM
jgi:hypothetical protein